MLTHKKPLPFVLAVSIFICVAPSTVPAAVLYSNGFESGVPVYIYDNDMEDDETNGACNFGHFGGTGKYTNHRGCLSVVPTSRINAGSGSFVAWADPDQSYEGGFPISGSTIKIFPSFNFVDGWHGRYELSFNGSGIAELVFYDQVWATDLSPGSDWGGMSVSIQGNSYLITIDFDKRIRDFADIYGSEYVDLARGYLCPSEEFECGFIAWTFAIDNGGWLDDIKMNYLGTGQGSTSVPEPGTLKLILTGLIAAGTLKLRTSRQIDVSSRLGSVSVRGKWCK